MSSTRTQLIALLNSKILTGGNRTTAQNIRDFENEIIQSVVNLIDDDAAFAKYDTAANFTSTNPILLVRQFGVETDSLLTSPKFKFGDGVTAWNSLPYATSGGSTGLVQIYDPSATFFSDLATAMAWLRGIYLVGFGNTLVDESFREGVYSFTPIAGAVFNGPNSDYFLANSNAIIVDEFGLIALIGGGNSFENNTGIGSKLPNMQFYTLDFVGFNGTIEINTFDLITGFGGNFAENSTGKFIINRDIGGSGTAQFGTGFFLNSTATIHVKASEYTSNAGGIQGDLAQAMANGANVFFDGIDKVDKNNIKTVGGISLIGTGNIPVGTPIVSSIELARNNYKVGSFTKLSNGATVFNATFNNNNIVLDIPVSDGTLLNKLRYDGLISARESFKLTQTFIVNSNGAQNEGLGFSLIPQSGDMGSKLDYALITGNVANKGKHVWVINNTFGFYSTSVLPINLYDSIVTSIEKIDDTYILTSTNITQNVTITDNVVYPYNYPAAYLIPPYFKFAFCSFGGTQQINFWKFETNETINCDALFIGDSKTVGYYAGSTSNKIINLLKTALPSKRIYSSSGAGGLTSSALLIMPELLEYKPLKVFIWIGCNDVRSGGAYTTNYPQIVSELESIGATVIHCLSTPENGINVTPLNTFISTRYASSTIIDLYTPFWSGSGTSLNPIYNSGDGIHLNALAQPIISNLIAPHI